MAKTAADVLIDTIHDWGVDVVFGLPGDGINGIMEALRKRQDEVRFVHVRHEESAAFMACAYAKVTGKLGVCLATSGPGGRPGRPGPMMGTIRPESSSEMVSFTRGGIEASPMPGMAMRMTITIRTSS